MIAFLNWDSLHARLNSRYEAWSSKKKKLKKINAQRKSVQKEPTVKRYPLILDLKPFRSQVKGKHSIGREFESLAVQGKKLLTRHPWNGDRKIMQKIMAFINHNKISRKDKKNPFIREESF